MNTTSYWQDSAPFPRLSKLNADQKVDVVVVGAGITGITAAYLLKSAGHTVALVDRGHAGGFDTANTTAHLTYVTDTSLRELVKHFGRENAAKAWSAGRAAIDQIDQLIQTKRIDCDFKWVPGYYHAPWSGPAEEAKEALREEATLAEQLGFPARYVDSVPVAKQPGVYFEMQAKFNPRKYLAALLRTIPGDGSHVFINTDVEEVQSDPPVVKAGKFKLHCRYVVLATHTPIVGKVNLVSATLFQSKLFLYTSYALGARVPSGFGNEACYWEKANPYHYLRVDHHADHDYLIFGGEDHKTGQEANPAAAYKRLEHAFRKIAPRAKIDHRWSGQVIETPDGLPYMGETAPHQFVATGFGGNGMTFGTLGAMMAVDAFRRHENPWKSLFDLHRKSVAGVGHYLKENADYLYYLGRGWLPGHENKSLSSVKRNSGKLVNLNGHKVAAYRDAKGKLTVCSAACTHMGCAVGWNDAEKTWDCPCHGSRFAATGEVLSGPAEKPLEPVSPEDGTRQSEGTKAAKPKRRGVKRAGKAGAKKRGVVPAEEAYIYYTPMT